jgi:hypothetical protein
MTSNNTETDTTHNDNPYEDCSHIPNHQLFQTGDILLFSDKKFIPSILIEDFTHSKYSHTGIILRDPTFPSESFKGLYILESTGYIDAKDVETHQYKVGVQINKLSKVYDVTNGEIYWRRLTTERNEDFGQILSEVHKLTHDKGYDFDPDDWIKAYFDWHHGNEQKENVFICSALVAFLYDRLGFLKKPVEWTIVRPVDWGTEYPPEDRRIHIDNCQLDKEVQIRFVNPEDPTKPPKDSDSDSDSDDQTWSIWSYLYAPVGFFIRAITEYKRD